MAEEIELLGVQGIPVEEGAGIDADNADDVVIDSSLLRSMEEKLVSTYRTKSSPFTICRVPANIRKYDHAAYDPRIVSIGPFHRGREELQAMEESKWRCLQEILTCKPENNLEKLLKEMRARETRARNCYFGNIQYLSSDQFVEMMLLDGSFIIGLILGFVTRDPLIPDYERVSGLIRFDMFLLENQLPFFVLECLWELIGLPTSKLRDMAFASCRFFSLKLERKNLEEHVIHHLLHLLHLSLKRDSPTGEAQTTSASSKLSYLRLCQSIGKTLHSLCTTYLINTYDMFRTPSQRSLPEPDHKSPKPLDVIPSATELHEAGVRFHQLEQARSFFEVRFEQGSMEMSRLCIYDSTGILFRNLIAFEQCFRKWGNDFTSYCLFIDFLVNTPRDVSILREAGIIQNGLGSNEEVTLLFNKLGKGIIWGVDGSYLADLFKRVNHHTQKRWPEWRAKLARDYFGSPWAIISLIAAAIILMLTFLQTFFSVFDHFNPPKS